MVLGSTLSDVKGAVYHLYPVFLFEVAQDWSLVSIQSILFLSEH